ncbi:MAG: sugar-binding protein [Candidatus Sumerlaeia bacterium]
MRIWNGIPLLAILTASCASLFALDASDKSEWPKNTYVAPRAEKAPVIDGKADDACWDQAQWDGFDYLWLGEKVTPEDFSGRYKIVWTRDRVYILCEITDDVLLDVHKDPLKQWPNDDCVEIFVDADKSGGEHTFSHNAFAYHVATDYNVVDMGPDKRPHTYNDHVKTKITKEGNLYTWEMEMTIYGDDYDEKSDKNQAMQLKAGHEMGFMMAYCDNDASPKRESFIGTIVNEGVLNNMGWKNADCFGTLVLSGAGTEPKP